MPLAVIYITATVLFIAVAPLPYGYYTLLRIVATVAFVWAAIAAYERECEVLPWVFSVMAIVFNPIIKIHLPREVWAAVDIAAGILLLATQSVVRNRRV